jgi:hypothetical protein
MTRTADTAITSDIVSHLVSDSVGTAGSTDDWGIFENSMPSKPDKCIAVFVYGGMAPDLSWEGEYPSVQVRIRGGRHRTDAQEQAYATENAVHAATWAKARDVMKSLHETTRTTLNGVVYYWLAAKHSPASLGRDSAGRDIYVINFDVMKEYE